MLSNSHALFNISFLFLSYYHCDPLDFFSILPYSNYSEALWRYSFYAYLVHFSFQENIFRCSFIKSLMNFFNILSYVYTVIIAKCITKQFVGPPNSPNFNIYKYYTPCNGDLRNISSSISLVSIFVSIVFNEMKSRWDIQYPYIFFEDIHIN